MMFNTWQVVNEWAKYCTNWLCSVHMWRHNNGSHLYKNFNICAQLNYLQNLYFRFFAFWKLTELCHFVTYLSDDPRITYMYQMYSNSVSSVCVGGFHSIRSSPGLCDCTGYLCDWYGLAAWKVVWKRNEWHLIWATYNTFAYLEYADDVLGRSCLAHIESELAKDNSVRLYYRWLTN